MRINGKSIVTVTAGLVAGGAIGFAAGVPGLTSAADAPMVDTVDGEQEGVTRSERLRDALQPLVDDTTIDGEQADAVSEHLAATLPGRGEGHRSGRALGAHSEVVTDLLGIDAATLRSELAAGSTLAEVAEANGVSPDDLVAALVDEAAAHLAEHVADGSLTEAEAADRLAEMTDRVTERVNTAGLAERMGGHGDGGRGGHGEAHRWGPGAGH